MDIFVCMLDDLLTKQKVCEQATIKVKLRESSGKQVHVQNNNQIIIINTKNVCEKSW